VEFSVFVEQKDAIEPQARFTCLEKSGLLAYPKTFGLKQLHNPLTVQTSFPGRPRLLKKSVSGSGSFSILR
jgi:hypothetical protein